MTPDVGPSAGPPAIRDGAGNRSTSLPASGTDITPGNLTQAAVNAAGVGATLKLRAGDHRLTSTLSFLQGQQVCIEDGAKVKGSALVTGWTAGAGADTGRWFKTGQTQDFTAQAAIVLGASSNGDNPVATTELEDYYLDGVPMIAVTSKNAVTVGSNKKWMDRANDTVWIGVDPTARTVERLMFFGHLLTTGGNSVVVKGGILEHAGYSCFSIDSRNACILEDVELRYGHLRSLHSSTSTPATYLTGNQIRHCYVHHGGRYNHNLLYQTGMIVEYCEFEAGNDLHFGNRAGGVGQPNDEGASKALHTLNMIWRYNWSHGHDGSEWFDTDNLGVSMTESVFEDSYQIGAFCEDNHGGWTIRRNLFRDCGRTHPTYGAWALGHHHAGLYVSCSDDVEVDHNLFQTTPATTYFSNGDIKLAFQSGRGGLHRLRVHHNRFERTGPASVDKGFINTRGSEPNVRYAVNDNTYDYDDYHVPVGAAASTWFHWDGGNSPTFAQWQAGESLPFAPGSSYDPHGTLTADL